MGREQGRPRAGLRVGGTKGRRHGWVGQRAGQGPGTRTGAGMGDTESSFPCGACSRSLPVQRPGH